MSRAYVKSKLEQLMNYISAHMLELSGLGFFSLFISWHIGFYLNGFYGYHFDLGSVWQGISTLFGAGVFSSIKYVTDSCKNSPLYNSPYNKEGANNEKSNN